MKATLLSLPQSSPSDEVWGRPGVRALAYVAGSVAAGAVAGLLWFVLAPRPSYSISEELRAYIPERELAGVVGADVYFAALTAVLGLGLGILAWAWFHREALLAVMLALTGGLLAALITWRFGLLIGGSGFSARLAAAGPGELVQVDLELRALAALVCAPFFAMLPVMVASAFLPERGPRRGRDQQAETSAK